MCSRTPWRRSIIKGWVRLADVRPKAESLKMRFFIQKLLFISVVFPFLLALPTSVLAKSLEEEIIEVKAVSDHLLAEARKRGRYDILAIDVRSAVDQHRCAILGRALGHEEYILDLEDIEIPEPKDVMTEREVEELFLAAASLSKWVQLARRILGLSENERATIWNLECVGYFDIPDEAWVESEDTAATFRVKGGTLFVLGYMELGFARELAAQLDAHPTIEWVALGSGGGIVWEGISAGREIRSRRLKTTLTNDCVSACSLVFLAGVERQIFYPWPDLGLHQASSDGQAISEFDLLYQHIKVYLQEIEVDAEYVLSAMLSASPEEMVTPDIFELCDRGLATRIKRLGSCPRP